MCDFLKGITLVQMLQYALNGFIFIGIWRFVQDKSSESNPETHLSVCVVIGLYLCTMYGWIKELRFPKVADAVYISASCAMTAVLAYILARIVTAGWMEKVLSVLRVYTTYPDNFWYKLQDKRHVPMWAEVEYNGCVYYGQIELIETREKHPRLSLVYYERKDLNGNMIEDCTHDYTQKIIIDTSKCDTIKLLYDA